MKISNSERKIFSKSILAATLALIMIFSAACVAGETGATPVPTAPAGTGASPQVTTPGSGASTAPSSPTPTPEPQPLPEATLSIEKLEEYEDYLEKNNDFIGKISIPGTKLDYPVVHHTDDVYYVYHNFDKTKSAEGAIFLGIDASLPLDTKNMVLHGHNMKDNSKYGRMFGYLHEYSTNTNRAGEKGLDYYKEHPTVNFDTIYGDGEYKIFAFMYIDVTEPEDRKDALFFYLYNDFESDEQFMQFVTEIQRRSLIETTVDVKEEDEILLLSTCDTNGLFRGPNGETLGHFVVAARKVRDGESSDVDVDGAKIAENPLMDALWYSKGYGDKAPEFDDRDDKAPWLYYAD
jgi:SrtB family sortase